MFHQVSWQTYFIAFAIVAGLYYIVIFILFFRVGVKNSLQRIRNRQSRADKSGSESNSESDTDDYTTYQSLRDDMTAFMEAAEPDMFKSDILFSLASIIKKYPALNDERFQEALTKEIRRMYLHKYNDGIEEEELSVLWQV